MKSVVGIICCVVTLMVLVMSNIQVEAMHTQCAKLKGQLVPCLVYLKHCRDDNFQELPSTGIVCKAPPLPCCLNLGWIGRRVNSDIDAKNLCSCILKEVIEEDDNLAVSGKAISRLPKACMIDMKIPEINEKTNCAKWKLKNIKGTQF
ncbi:hypothetical protein Tco_0052655 [Tanacetum coccineum]